jgi:hypothetical protein
MSDLLQLIQEADIHAIEMETAREGVEAAKLALEAAKERFDQTRSQFDLTVAKADEIGVPRAKFKKMIEERTSAFFGSGLVEVTERAPKAPKAPRAVKKPKATEEVVDLFPEDASEPSEQQAYAN